MIRFEREMRGIPLWLLQEYLEELGGVSVSVGFVEGEGWTARITQMEDFQLGSLRVGQIRLEMAARPDVWEKMQPALEKKLLRAGG